MGLQITQGPMVNTGLGAPDQCFHVQIIKPIFQFLAQIFRIGSLLFLVCQWLKFTNTFWA